MKGTQEQWSRGKVSGNLRKGTPDVNAFFDQWRPQVLRKCRDTLDAYLWEGLTIKQLKPSINKYPNNGFTDFSNIMHEYFGIF